MEEPEWTIDTGASTHMTSTPGILSHLQPYAGPDKVMVGNGNLFNITYTGHATIVSGSTKLTLENVLLVPDLERNLLSIGQLTTTFPITCEFTGVDFSIKDKDTHRILLKGIKHGNLYTIPTTKEAHFSVRFQAAGHGIWHQRLGHPNEAALRTLCSFGLINVAGSQKGTSLYASCQLGKLSRFPFSCSSNKDYSLFEKIHCGLWGPAPVNSMHNFSYYTCFVDDYSRYVWLVPLKRKSDFFRVFYLFV